MVTSFKLAHLKGKYCPPRDPSSHHKCQTAPSPPDYVVMDPTLGTNMFQNQNGLRRLEAVHLRLRAQTGEVTDRSGGPGNGREVDHWFHYTRLHLQHQHYGTQLGESQASI